VYRAADQHVRVIDVLVSKTRGLSAASMFFSRAVRDHGRPREVTTDLAAPLLHVLDELLPDAAHDTS
jgi:transposase-like protein